MNYGKLHIFYNPSMNNVSFIWYIWLIHFAFNLRLWFTFVAKFHLLDKLLFRYPPPLSQLLQIFKFPPIDLSLPPFFSFPISNKPIGSPFLDDWLKFIFVQIFFYLKIEWLCVNHDLYPLKNTLHWKNPTHVSRRILPFGVQRLCLFNKLKPSNHIVIETSIIICNSIPWELGER